MNRLAGKVAIVTGASQGMGEAHARCMVAEGAKVMMTDINEKAGQKIAAELGENARFMRHDVANLAEWQAVVDATEKAFGLVNVLINNAGIIGEIASTTDLTVEQYQKVIDVNQLGVFLGMKSVLPSMLKAGKGSIVNISSIAGLVAIYGSPNLAYVGSKFAVRGMTKQVASEYGKKNIRVNSVHPGYIRTPMMAAATDEEGAGATAQIPLGRLAKPEEVSSLIIFLASDESSFITAAEHVIDGGMVAL
jgi:3alpha(or 20beta)-hydroxysteroid dehydrogenase